MNRQTIYDMVAEAIKNGEFKCIHALEREDNTNIVVTLERDFLVYVNEDGTAQIIVKGNAHMLTNIKRQQLLDMSEEYKAAAEERKRIEEEKARQQEIEDMMEKLPRWKEQHAVLEQKIREAEQLAYEQNSHGVREEEEVPAPEENKKRWYQKVFSSGE